MTQNQTQNSEYMFKLIGQQDYCFYDYVQANFAPDPKIIFIKQLSSNINQSVLPSLLKDKNYFTPAFVISRQKKSLEFLVQVQRKNFMKKIRNAQKFCKDEKNIEKSVKFYKVLPKEMYCAICQQKIQHYWDHLQDWQHRMKTHNSKANKYIAQICKKYYKRLNKHSKQKQARKNKSKQIYKFNKNKKSIQQIQIQSDPPIKNNKYNSLEYVMRVEPNSI